MLIGIFSDSHLGFSGDDRYDESFNRFKESLRIFFDNKVDCVLHAGDLFDEAVPSQEVWLRAFECFAMNTGDYSKLNKTSFGLEKKVMVKGIPIIAIHGTHEFRGKDFANALDILEESNCLVHLHAGVVSLQKGDDLVHIHGLGGIPEKHAKDALVKYNPQPIQGGANILLLHQSFKEYLPFAEDDMVATLSLTDLPTGFDLIINGHLHWTQEQRLQDKRFLLTGSAIFTQMKKLEAEHPKGVFLFDTKTKKLDFIPFVNQRRLFYEKIIFRDARPDDVIRQVNEKVNSFLSIKCDLRPLIRIKIVGSLAKGFTQSDVLLDFSGFSDKAIFSISKNFEVESFRKHVDSLRVLQLEKKSITDVGVGILEKNLDEAGLKGIDARRLFELLSVGELDKAEDLLVNS